MGSVLGNMLIAHGGGPTCVINSSLQGAIEEAREHPEIGRIYGARFGAEGILKGDLIDLGIIPQDEIGLLSQTPASAIGSCRRKLNDADYPAVLECFKKFNIRYFFYNGGNDSMDTCAKISRLAKKMGIPVNVIGIPKTIDNDLVITDHSPGFGSAARYAAISALELSFDASALPIHAVVLELMGRNAGWITAAASLFKDRMPSELLTYLPEIPLDGDRFLNDVQNAFAKQRGLLIAVSEGVKYTNGKPVGETGRIDGFGHPIPGGAAQALADLIIHNTPLKARAEKPGLLGRVSIGCQSTIDRQEAYDAGRYAVNAAVEGEDGFMVSIDARRDPRYSSSLSLCPLDDVANAEKKFPLEWLNEQKNGVTEDFIGYCLPLIGNVDLDYCYLR